MPVEPIVLTRMTVLDYGDWLVCKRCEAVLRRRARSLREARRTVTRAGAHD